MIKKSQTSRDSQFETDQTRACICVCLLMPLFEPDKGKETIYTGYRNLFWMYGHSRAELIYTGLPKIGTRFITKKLGISRFRQTGHVQKIGTLTILPNMPRPKNWDFYLIWAISATFREYPGASFLEKNPKFTF